MTENTRFSGNSKVKDFVHSKRLTESLKPKNRGGDF